MPKQKTHNGRCSVATVGYLVMYDKSIDIKTVEHKVGGEPMQVPTCSYVKREKAYEIISSFIKHKKIPDFVTWVDLYDIDFEYEF